MAAAGVKATGGPLLPFVLLLSARFRRRASLGAGATLLVLGGAALLVGSDLLASLVSVHEHVGRVSQQGGPREVARLSEARRLSEPVEMGRRPSARVACRPRLADVAHRTVVGAAA